MASDLGVRSAQPRPRFLKSAVALVSNRANQFAAFNTSGQPTSYYSPAGSRTQFLSSTVTTPLARIIYSEIKGRLVVCPSAPGWQIPFGTLLDGRAELIRGSSRTPLKLGETLIVLPGDDVAYELVESSSFALRAMRGTELLYRIKAMPFCLRKKVSRILSPNDSKDLLQLFRFISVEHERLSLESEPEASDQLLILVDAAVSRAAKIVRRMLDLPDPSAPEYLGVVKRCDDHIVANPGRVLNAKEMAEVAFCSVRQLYRAFEAISKCSPIEYQERCRLLELRSAQLNTCSAPDDFLLVALNHGFYNTSKLEKDYTREFGESPYDVIRRRAIMVEGMTKVKFEETNAKG